MPIMLVKGQKIVGMKWVRWVKWWRWDSSWHSDCIQLCPVITTNATRFLLFRVLTRFPHYGVVTWKLRRDILPANWPWSSHERSRILRKILNPPSGVAWTLTCLQYAMRIGVIFGNRWYALPYIVTRRDLNVRMIPIAEKCIPERYPRIKIYTFNNANIK